MTPVTVIVLCYVLAALGLLIFIFVKGNGRS
jgi:hypothetical protein